MGQKRLGTPAIGQQYTILWVNSTLYYRSTVHYTIGQEHTLLWVNSKLYYRSTAHDTIGQQATYLQKHTNTHTHEWTLREGKIERQTNRQRE